MRLAIIGQGLAGCSLAWHLEWAGADFSVWDEPHPQAASRVAAGMINPVTGKNYTLSDRFAECIGEASAFYQKIEATVGVKIWHPLPVVRLVSEKEWPKVEAKLSDPELAPWVDRVEPGTNGWRAAVVLRGGGRVAARDFCEATVRHLRAAGKFQPPAPGDRLVHCEGAAGLMTGLLGPHRSAKGEILTLAADWPQDRILVGGGGWLVPVGGGKFKAGATYVWDQLDDIVTDAGREIVTRLVRQLAGDDFEVTGHEAGVRPIVRRSQPVAGELADGSVVFNGLGSKGSLYAPSVAANLAAWLTRGASLDPGWDVKFLPR